MGFENEEALLGRGEGVEGAGIGGGSGGVGRRRGRGAVQRTHSGVRSLKTPVASAAVKSRTRRKVPVPAIRVEI